MGQESFSIDAHTFKISVEEEDEYENPYATEEPRKNTSHKYGGAVNKR